jgi:argininosuccinate synthase
MKKKIVLAYSGGLDTSVSIKWIQQKYDADVVTMTIDVGQGKELKTIEKRAIAIGALKHYSIDAKEEFVTNYVFRAIKANALYESKYPVSSALSRPLIASKLVDVANKEEAIGVAHGCTGKGNDQVRFDVTIKSLNPDLKIIAPVREWKLSRDEEIKYAEENKIPIDYTSKNIYSIDQNLWGRSIECGVLEQPDHEPPEDAYEWTTDPVNAPDKPEYLSIGFKNGVPQTINGKKLNPIDLISNINKIAGQHGIGRIDHMENRLVGIKSREIYECPAATVILEAHKDLEKAILTRHEWSFKQQIDNRWALLAYTGLWMDPLRHALEAFINKTQENVTGEVKVKLYKGSVQVVGRSSPYSLYDLNLATYESSSTFDQTWSIGFIELWGMPTKAANIVMKKNKTEKP